MKRRSFLQSLLLGGAVLFQPGLSVSARLLNAVTVMGGKRVNNARPVPPFTVENFKDTPAKRFLVIGDWGAGGKFQSSVATQMRDKAAASGCDFVISTGDNIYTSGVTSAQDPQWKTKFENMYLRYKELDIPWYAVLGNHDYRGNVDAQIEYGTVNPRWNMPSRYYSFRQNIDTTIAVDFFALDTQRIMNGSARDEQKQWLEKELKKSTARWKIVFGHHMIRSHGGYGDQAVMLRTIKPLLDTYGVDLYMCGHDHDLQFLKATEDSFHCLISGAGGGANDTSYGENTVFAATNGGFVHTTVSAQKLHAQFIDREGTVMYAHTLTKKL